MGSPASAAGESAYCIESSIAGSTRVVLVASEPITQSSGDWVAVPTNTALVVSREKGGCIDIIRAPLAASACRARQEEVKMCASAACIVHCNDAYLMSPCPRDPQPGLSVRDNLRAAHTKLGRSGATAWSCNRRPVHSLNGILCYRCLEAVTSAAEISAKVWKFAEKRPRPSEPFHGSLPHTT